MDTDAITIGQLCDLTGTWLPADWGLDIKITLGCLDVVLYDPDGNRIEFDDGDTPDLPGMILRRVNFARDKDGLGPVDWSGDSVPLI